MQSAPGDSEEEESKHNERTAPRTNARMSIGSRSKEQREQHDALVKKVLAGAYLASAGKNASELARRLKQTWTVLQRMPNHHEGSSGESCEVAVAPLAQLRLVCTELLREQVLASSDAIVRALAACCFAEQLRLHAPGTPFMSNEELYDAFQLMLEQIRCLAGTATAADRRNQGDIDDDASSVHTVHLLESLASAKLGALLAGVDFTVEEDEPVLLVQLFSTMFETLQPAHTSKIESLMVAIMAACIDDLDMIDQPLLDVILAPLVHANPSGGSSSIDALLHETDAVAQGPYHMAQTLIERTSEQLQNHLSLFFNSILVDAPTALASLSSSHPPTSSSSASALKEHIYTLIYEVHKIAPTLLLYVLPNVCLQLQVDEVATRSEALTLMARLFASAHADYGHEYMPSFRDFLGRFRDVSKEIRLQMVHACVVIWQRKPELASLIETECVLRLSDPEWEVRRLVVNELCDLAANHLEVVSEECLRHVGERMKDKRVLLRKETMTGLSQVYAAHVSTYWSRDDATDDEPLSAHHVPAAHAKKLGWVPDFVLKCFSYPQQELKLRVVQLLDDILLPKAASAAVRAKGLLYLFHSVDAASKEALRRILSERARCVVAVRAFVGAKKRQREQQAGGLDAAASSREAGEQLFAALAPLFPETPNLRALLEQLSAGRDHTVFKHMGHLCDYSLSLDDMRSARDRLVKSVGSKTPLGEFLKTLCRKLNLLTLQHATIRAFLDYFIDHGAQPSRENRHIADLLVMVSKIAPEIFAPFINDAFEKILVTSDASAHDSDEDEGSGDDDDDEDDEESSKDLRVIEGILGVLANYSAYWHSTMEQSSGEEIDVAASAVSAMPSVLLASQLEQFCLSPNLGADGRQSSAVLSAREIHVSKLAALSIANFFGLASSTSVLIQKLCAKKRLATPMSPYVLATLQSLLVFTKRCGSDFATKQSLLTTLWTTLADDFLADDAGHADPQTKSRKRTVTHAKMVEIRSLALKVMVHVVLYCHQDVDSTEFSDRSQQLVTLLFELLQSDGRKWTANAGFASKYRVVAASSLLKLVRNARIERLVTVSQWHVLGFVMQDSSEDVRAAFLDKLTKHLMRHVALHPHKYLSYLVLAASESSAGLKKRARTLLGVAIERMRRTFEASLARSRTSDASAAERSALLVPEYALPYVIHLLAHHPDFPRDAAQRSVSSHVSLFHNPIWSSQVQHLSFFLDALVPTSASAEADNIAFVLQMLAKLSECDDVTDPSSTHMYPLVDSAALLVKKKIKNQSSLKPYPGRIYLPKQLFVAGSGHNATPSKRSGAIGAAGAVTSTRNSSDTVGHQRGPRMMVRLVGCFRVNARLVEYSRLTVCLIMFVQTSLSPIKGSADIRDYFMQLTSPPASSAKKKKRRSSTGTPSASRKASKQQTTSSPSPLAPAMGTPANASDGAATPARRTSRMRKARLQSLSFAEVSSESSDDSDDVVPRASVAARSSKIQARASLLATPERDLSSARSPPPREDQSGGESDLELHDHANQAGGADSAMVNSAARSDDDDDDEMVRPSACCYVSTAVANDALTRPLDLT